MSRGIEEKQKRRINVTIRLGGERGKGGAEHERGRWTATFSKSALQLKRKGGLMSKNWDLAGRAEAIRAGRTDCAINPLTW